MKTKKATAFWAVFWFSAGCIAVASWRTPAMLPDVIASCLFAVVGVATVYTGGNVADNFQRAKYFRPELQEPPRVTE